MASLSGRSAVWGGATIGLVVGVIVGLLSRNFLPSATKGLLIGAAVGIFAEVIGAIGEKLRH